MTAERIHAPQFQLYKESTIPWAPVIPNHWETKRAKSLFKKMERPVRESDEVVTCFRDGTVTLRRNRRESGFTESLKQIGYQGIRPGDLVIHAMDAFAGAIGVSDSAGKGTPVYSVCTPIGEANPLYYAHALREMSRNKWIESLAKGIRERSSDFRFTEFSAQVVPVPPPEEQAAIVRFLDHADEQIQRYIASKERLIALLEEERQALVHQAVTRGLDPNVRLKPSGVEWMGDIPEHWEVVPFKRRVGFQEGPGIMAADFRESGVPLLRISCLRGPVATLDGCNYLDPDVVRARWSHFAIKEGDYLLSASASTGVVSLATSTVADCVPYTGIIRLWYASPRTVMPYVRLFLSSRLFLDQVDLEKAGVTISHFGPTHLSRMVITLPPEPEQQAIVEYIDKATAGIDAAIARARQQIELVEEYRTRLIADVVTGKIDVREAAERLPELKYEDRTAEPQTLSLTQRST